MALKINHDDNSLQLNKVAAPENPPAGTVVLYFDTNGKLALKNESGGVTEVVDTNWFDAINNGASFPTAPIGTGARSIAVGNNATSSTFTDAIALGTSTVVTANFGVAIGADSDATLIYQTSVGNNITSASVGGGLDLAYDLKLGYGLSTDTTNYNMLHLYDSGKLELYGAEAQFVLPNYATASIPSTTVEGGIIYDSDTKSLKYYNGSGWTDVGLSNFVEITGDTMTGKLTLNYGNQPTVSVHPDTGGGFPQFNCLDTAGVIRAQFVYNEATGDLLLQRKDSGAIAETTFTFGNDGNVSLTGGSNVPTGIAHLTRKDYVDTTTVALDGSRIMTGSLQFTGVTDAEIISVAEDTGDVNNEWFNFHLKDHLEIEMGRIFVGRQRAGWQIRDTDGSTVLSSLYLLPDANVLATAGAPGTDLPATPTLDTHLINKKYVDDNYLNLADSYYAGHHPEGRLLASAALTNDLANARLRGSTFSFTNISPVDADIDKMFDGLASILNITVATTTWPVVIEFTVPRTLKFGTTIGIGFGAEFWYCESVKIEAHSEGGWVTCIDTTTNTSEDVVAIVPGNSNIGVTSLRYTLDNPIGTSMRIAHLWGFNYDSDMWSQLQMPRAGGTMYGPMTIESETPSLITRTTGTTGYHAWSIRDSADIWRMQLGVDLSNNIMKLIYTDGTGTQKCRMELDNNGLASIYNTTGTSAPTTPTADNNLTPKKYVDDLDFAIKSKKLFNFDSVLTNVAIPEGLSRFYNTHADSPDASWNHCLTIKDSTSRGFQIAVPDGENELHFRNQTTDGAAWQAWKEVFTTAGGTITGNVDLSNSDLDNVKTVTFNSEIVNTGTTQTINWTAGQKQNTTITAATGVTFTAPAGPSNLTLKIVNGGTGVITWPGTVLWPGGSEPAWTTSGTDIASFYFDGTNYYGMSGLAFA